MTRQLRVIRCLKKASNKKYKDKNNQSKLKKKKNWRKQRHQGEEKH